MTDVVNEARSLTLARIAQDAGRSSEEVAKLLRYLATHLFEVGFRTEDVRLDFGREAADLAQAFDAELGIRLDDYIAEAQLEVAVRLLLDSDHTPAQISRLLGYRTPSAFNNVVRRHFGHSPSKLRCLVRAGFARYQRNGTVSPSSTMPKAERARIGRRLAESIWDFLSRLQFPEQISFVRRHLLFASEELFELLSRFSTELGRRNRQLGIEVAELALAAVEGSAGALGDRFGSLHALALARLGNSRTLAGDLHRSNDAFRMAERILIGIEGAIDRAVKAEVFFLKGVLRVFERRFDEALDVLNSSLEISMALKDVNMQVNALMQRVALRWHQDRAHEMLPDLAKVQDLLETQPDQDRNQLLGVYQNMAAAHLDLEHGDEASRYLSQAKELCEELDHTKSRHQLEWIEGRLVQRGGDAVLSDRLLRQARLGLLALGDRVTASLVTVDIAILCHEQGQFREVLKLLVGDALPVLEAVPLHAEALAAIQLLHEAVAAEEASVATLHKVREVLRRIHRDPARSVGLTNAPETEQPSPSSGP